MAYTRTNTYIHVGIGVDEMIIKDVHVGKFIAIHNSGIIFDIPIIVLILAQRNKNTLI